MQLAHCDACSMFYADKPRPSEKSRDISWATRIGEKHAAPDFTVNTRVQHAQVVLAQRNKMAAYLLLRIGWVSQRIRRYLRLYHLRQYCNGKKIRRIVKLYGLFLHKVFFGGSKQEFAAIFSDMSPPKFLTAKNRLTVQLNGFWHRFKRFSK